MEGAKIYRSVPLVCMSGRVSSCTASPSSPSLKPLCSSPPANRKSVT